MVSELKPAPTRPVMMASDMLHIGANWTNSNSPRTKKILRQRPIKSAADGEAVKQCVILPGAVEKERNLDIDPRNSCTTSGA